MLTWPASCGCLVAWFLQSYTDTLLLFLWFKLFPPVICWCNHLCNIMLHKWLHQHLCPLQHWVISNSENNSRSISISSHRGLPLKLLYLGSNFMSEQECVVASSVFNSDLKTQSFQKIPALFWEVSLHCLSCCFLDFLGARIASKSTKQQNVWSHSGAEMRLEAKRLLWRTGSHSTGPVDPVCCLGRKLKSSSC